MKKHSLATVLVKVLGLSTAMFGLSQIAAQIIHFLLTQGLPHTANPFQSLWEVFSNTGVFGITNIALALVLIKKADWVVQTILQINSDE